MRILIVTYSYLPALTPRAFRWSAIAAELARRGHDVHVLCAATGQQDEEPEGVTVHRVRDWLLDGASRVSAAPRTAATGGSNGPRAALRCFARGLWRSLYWPDFACGWVIPGALAARRLCAQHRFDWVISVSHPFTGHVVGLWARRAAKHARWFADIGDPFHLMAEPAPNNFRLYGWLNRRVEGRVVARCDAMSVTTEATRALYAGHFPRSVGKITVIAPLLSLPPNPLPTPGEDSQVRRLVFVGTLYRQLRSPRFLLDCFAALRVAMSEHRLELHFYGAVNDCADAFPPDGHGVFVHGMVPRTQVQQAMVDADLLVNIGNHSQAQLASKVVEYMAAGRPILNLVSIAGDASEAALDDYPAALTVQREDTPSAATVDRIGAFLAAPLAVPPSAADEVRARFAPSVIAAQYAALLETATP